MHDASETAQTDGDGPDGSDKPPHDGISQQQQSSIPPTPQRSRARSTSAQSVGGRSTRSHKSTTPIDSSSSHPSVPLPPPESGALPKEPGYTKLSLGNLVLQTAAHQNVPVHGSETPSSVDSPSGSDSDSWGHSTTSTRPPSRVASRAPSMSRGKSGGEAETLSKTPVATVAAAKKEPDSAIARAPEKTKITEVAAAAQVATVVPHPTPRSRAPSVNSDSGHHKFTLKELLASGPKLNRKSSARSTASSRKSDSDGERRSTAGDSTASLSKKYGVCERAAIGKGATSVVRLAHKWDHQEEKLYAVKEFRKRRKNETEKEYVKKLTAEFCISSTLHHVNIVETVDLVQDENQHWCEVMEYCPGGDLYAAIKKGGMSPSEVECCFKQILTGVKYLHTQGVAHRDIKPENLFFNARGQLKIGDYGASTVYRLPWESTVHMSTGLCGSEPYIAPELFAGRPYDARLVDIWACGIVYYCLHFQELPWRVAQLSDPLYAAYASACASTTSSHSSCPPTIANLSPRACRPLIRKMLEPDPKLRWKIEDVCNHAWVKSIAVCHEMEKPTHVHVYARAVSEAQAHRLP